MKLYLVRCRGMQTAIGSSVAWGQALKLAAEMNAASHKKGVDRG